MWYSIVKENKKPNKSRQQGSLKRSTVWRYSNDFRGHGKAK